MFIQYLLCLSFRVANINTDHYMEMAKVAQKNEKPALNWRQTSKWNVGMESSLQRIQYEKVIEIKFNENWNQTLEINKKWENLRTCLHSKNECWNKTCNS